MFVNLQVSIPVVSFAPPPHLELSLHLFSALDASRSMQGSFEHLIVISMHILQLQTINWIIDLMLFWWYELQ